MLEVALGVSVFTAIVTTLVLLILTARRILTPAGDVEINLNSTRVMSASAGTRLLSALATNDVLLPSACGGRGTCGQCTVTVIEGGGTPSAVETSLLTKQQLAEGTRLACQLTLRDNLALRVPVEILGTRKWDCTVRSNRNVATLMKELVLDLPAGEHVEFRAGSFVQATCPPHRTMFTSFDVDDRYRSEWDRLQLWQLVATGREPQTRAYSIASSPAETDRFTLVVRIATPPPQADESIPPGTVSSYLFALKPGDMLEISGPYGTFCTSDGDCEMVFVGGGAGIAPLRSMIVDLLRCRHSSRTISFWYGARNVLELVYQEEFEHLAKEFPNFRYVVALSEPDPHDAWDGDTGFIHEVLERRQIADHPAPQNCEYYLCGPPLMIEATLSLLERSGVDRKNVCFDDFGS